MGYSRSNFIGKDYHDNNSSATGATGLQILTEAGMPPMTVNSTTRVARLNTDRIDDREASSFANGVGGVATNAQLLDGKNSTDFLAAKLPAVRANSPTVSVPGDSTRTLLDFSGENFDQVGAGQSGEMHSTTTNNSRLTAPRNGIYQVNVQVG